MERRGKDLGKLRRVLDLLIVAESKKAEHTAAILAVALEIVLSSNP